MKKLVLLLVTGILLTSCGGDKKKETGEGEAEVSKDNYSIIFEGIYEKDDELVLQYKKAEGYMDYDHPIKQKITGQTGIQKITLAIPEGIALENFQFFISTNKEQKFVDLKSLTIQNNNKEVYNSGRFIFSKDFDPNAGIVYNPQKERFDLVFGGQFPPGFSGNAQLEMILVK